MVHATPKRLLYNQTYDELQETAWRLSRQILEMTTKAGSGHPSSSLSAIDILTVLFFGAVMRFNPEYPDWPERDRFILSKGHGVPALYAVLAEAGYFDAAQLGTLRQLGSPLEGHPNMRVLPGVEASTGSLGQGLSIGLGHALAARTDGRSYRVYVLIGDGESDEGQIWEAAMATAKFQTDNLTAILDYNKYQQTGSVNKVMPSLEPLVDKWVAFGWDVFEIVIVPADAPSTRAATLALMAHQGPMYLRTGRPQVPQIYQENSDFRIGQANRIREGHDVTIIACGLMVAVALEAAHILAADGIEARVLDMHTIKPIDEIAIETAAQETGAIVTAEEHLLSGGLGSVVARVVAQHYPVPMQFVGIHNTYAESGEPQELLAKYGLMPDNVIAAVRKVVSQKT